MSTRGALAAFVGPERLIPRPGAPSKLLAQIGACSVYRFNRSVCQTVCVIGKNTKYNVD